MKPEDLKSLKAKHPDHAGLIVDMFADGKTEAEMLAAITTAKEHQARAALVSERDALAAKVTQYESDGKAALSAKDDQIASLKADLAKSEKIAALGRGAPLPVGGLGTDETKGDGTALDKQWSTDADLRKRFGDDKESFVALSQLEAEQTAAATGKGRSTWTPINHKNIAKPEGTK